ncbi:hypothetical protein YPPY95_2630, partial [Yersinia pestis PY-95]
MDGLH